VPDGAASSAWGAKKLEALHVHSADDVGAGASGGDSGGGCSLLMSRNGRLEQARFHLAPLLPSGGGGGGGGGARWEGVWTTTGLPEPLRASGVNWDRWALLPAPGLVVRLDTAATPTRGGLCVHDFGSGAQLGAVPATDAGEVWSGVAALPPGVRVPGGGADKDQALLVLTTKNTAEIVNVARGSTAAAAAASLEGAVLGSLFSWNSSDAPPRPPNAFCTGPGRCCTVGAACCMRDGATAYLPSLRAVALAGSCGYGRTFPCMAFALPAEPPKATSAAGPAI
jgi:hypothetical protein